MGGDCTVQTRARLAQLMSGASLDASAYCADLTPGDLHGRAVSPSLRTDTSRGYGQGWVTNVTSVDFTPCRDCGALATHRGR